MVVHIEKYSLTVISISKIYYQKRGVNNLTKITSQVRNPKTHSHSRLKSLD